MNDISLVDIFFIITGSAVIIIAILLAIATIYLIAFVRTIRTVAKTAQRATEIVSEDISDLRKNIKENGVSLGAIAKFANNIRKGTSKK